MELAIKNKITNGYDDFILEQPGFRQLFEDHLSWVIDRGVTHRTDPLQAHKNHRDLSSYLLANSIEPKYHWCFMRANRLENNWDFTEDMTMITFPQIQDIIDISTLYLMQAE